jgi:hypothetical protein
MPTSQPSSASNNSTPASVTLPLTGIAIAGGVLTCILAYLIRKMLREQNAPQGENLADRKTSRLRKKKVSEDDLKRHNQELNALKMAVHHAELLDSENFQNKEFSMFSKIKSYIAHNVNQYADLNHVVDLLNVAMEAQKSFATIYQIESQYYSRHQQEFYNLVAELLEREDIDRAKFKRLICQQAELVCELLKTDEGKEAMAAYAKEVTKISEHDFGLSLLRLFKKNQMSDYSLIGGLRDSVNQLEKANLVDLDGLMLMVLEKSHVFERMGQVLDLKDEANSAETHRQVLQFIGLKRRYQESYIRFQQLLTEVKGFHRYYQSITNIRAQYSADLYRLPEEFTVELPGMKMYKKYMAVQDTYNTAPIDLFSQKASKAADKDSEEKKLFKNSWDRQKVHQITAPV